MKRPIVEIVWKDACTGGGWSDPRTYVEKEVLATCRSVGYLLDESRERVLLVQSQGERTGNVADSIAIPKANILSRRTLARRAK